MQWSVYLKMWWRCCRDVSNSIIKQNLTQNNQPNIIIVTKEDVVHSGTLIYSTSIYSTRTSPHPVIVFPKMSFILYFKGTNLCPHPSKLQEGLSAAWVPRDPLPECEESRGRTSSAMNDAKGGLVVFTANSHPPSRELGKRIAEWVLGPHVWDAQEPKLD